MQASCLTCTMTELLCYLTYLTRSSPAASAVRPPWSIDESPELFRRLNLFFCRGIIRSMSVAKFFCLRRQRQPRGSACHRDRQFVSRRGREFKFQAARRLFRARWAALPGKNAAKNDSVFESGRQRLWQPLCLARLAEPRFWGGKWFG